LRKKKEKRTKEVKKDIKKIIENIKKAHKNKTIPETTMSEALTKALVHPAFRERDMRKEAMDMGAHGAKEYFGDV
jgi:uncharacterized protein YlaN (UPF0358 family)